MKKIQSYREISSEFNTWFYEKALLVQHIIGEFKNNDYLYFPPTMGRRNDYELFFEKTAVECLKTQITSGSIFLEFYTRLNYLNEVKEEEKECGAPFESTHINITGFNKQQILNAYSQFINELSVELGKKVREVIEFENPTSIPSQLNDFAYLGIHTLIDLIKTSEVGCFEYIQLGLTEINEMEKFTPKMSRIPAVPFYDPKILENYRCLLLQKQELQLLRNLNDVNIKKLTNCKFKEDQLPTINGGNIQETAVEENVASKNDTEMTFQISHSLAAVRNLGLTEQARSIAELLLTSAELSDEDRELIEEQLTVINDTLSTE